MGTQAPNLISHKTLTPTSAHLLNTMMSSTPQTTSKLQSIAGFGAHVADLHGWRMIQALKVLPPPEDLLNEERFHLGLALEMVRYLLHRSSLHLIRIQSAACHPIGIAAAALGKSTVTVPAVLRDLFRTASLGPHRIFLDMDAVRTGVDNGTLDLSRNNPGAPPGHDIGELWWMWPKQEKWEPGLEPPKESWWWSTNSDVCSSSL